jgi:hypothetical protein
MTQLSTSLRSYWPSYVLTRVLLIGLVGVLALNRARDRELSDARAQIARLQQRISRVDRLEEKRAWGRLDEVAAGLAQDDPKVRKEALAQFRHKLHRLKVRYAHPQLGAADSTLKDEPLNPSR